MRKKTTSIPVNPMAGILRSGIGIERISISDLQAFEAAGQSHRDDYHLFFLQEKGTASIEIDFKKYRIKPCSVVYIHPNQVHRASVVENVTGSVWTIDNQNLSAEYQQQLSELAPVKPLLLDGEDYQLLYEAVSFCLKLQDKKENKLYYSLIRNQCNILVGLVISGYQKKSVITERMSRQQLINKSFKTLLEKNFTTVKSPAIYARKMNISPAYLNECVKNVTGYAVSNHIQQRIVLEAMRLLYHSEKSVKEIAGTLGYDDYSYFSRLFTKNAGMSALAFRRKNCD